MDEVLEVTYRVHCPAADIERRARSIALEQSVEVALEAVTNPWVREHIAGRVSAIIPDGEFALDSTPGPWANTDSVDGSPGRPGACERFLVTVHLAAATVDGDRAQLLSMLFGNVSLQRDVELLDAALPPSVLAAFAGPQHGIEGLRRLVGASHRALTCTALKPQGAPVDELAQLCRSFADAGIDVIKDDHGLANQATAPFPERVAACQRAVEESATGACYAPSVVGTPSQVADNLRIAAGEGVRMVLVAPMVYGLPAFAELAASHPELAFLGHPAFAGTGRIAPEFLFGRLFRLYGADAVIFPNHGGRFAFSVSQCDALATNARSAWGTLRSSLPVPAGGMSIDRTHEMLEFYGPDVMLLISGDLLKGPDVGARAGRFAASVRERV